MTYTRTFDLGNPMIATCLMVLTYLTAAVGIFFGFDTVLRQTNPSLTTSVLITIGGAGLLSFIRHSIFHKSDAKRMGWEQSGNVSRNNFQIEVGLANLAWALLALLTVCCNWGLAAEAACFLVFGFYLLFVAIFFIVIRIPALLKVGEKDIEDQGAEELGENNTCQMGAWFQLAAIVSFGSALTTIGVLGMEAAKRI